jgi:hypothetical protein
MMKIELRKLRLAKHLSQETPAYSAEIWIDGERAFLASNHGTGGPDFYQKVGRFTEEDVQAWLKANRPTRTDYGMTFDHDLECEVARLIDRSETSASLKRKLRNHIVTIEKGDVYQYPLKGRDPTSFAALLREEKPGIEIVNGGDAAMFERALNLLLRDSGDAR